MITFKQPASYTEYVDSYKFKSHAGLEDDEHRVLTMLLDWCVGLNLRLDRFAFRQRDMADRCGLPYSSFRRVLDRLVTLGQLDRYELENGDTRYGFATEEAA